LFDSGKDERSGSGLKYKIRCPSTLAVLDMSREIFEVPDPEEPESLRREFPKETSIESPSPAFFAARYTPILPQIDQCSEADPC
jgi:hypothetical protein